jgi:hypothetical protein
MTFDQLLFEPLLACDLPEEMWYNAFSALLEPIGTHE